jgi:AcrR family transcriptional regulator
MGGIMTKKEITYQKILESGLIEFGKYGYKLASTNNIYKTANTSKGTIFTYFKTKADLYYEVFKYYIKRFVERIDKVDLSGMDDVIDKIVHISLWKYEYFKNNQLEYNLFIEALMQPPKEISQKILSHLDMLTKLSLTSFFNEIDMTNISSEYTKQEVINYISLAMEGLKSEILKETITIDDFSEVKEKSIKFIKTLLKGMEK